MTRWPLRGTALAAAAVLTTSVAACGSPAGGNAAAGTIEVVAAFYPLQYALEQVGGSRVSVTNLTKPGAEPHEIELSPQDVATVSKARLAVYLKGFQPAVDQAVDQESTQALDVSGVTGAPLTFSPAVGAASSAEQHETTGTDPHVWLDPTRYDKIVRAVAARLAQIDPEHKGEYEKNAAAFSARLTALDKDFAAGLTQCTSRNLVTSHAAFGYLADRYRLRQVAIAGLSPENEPEPARLAQVADYAKKNQVRTIYSETLVDPAVARTVASETGATSAVLDPIEGVSDTSAAQDYEGIMRHNLATLRTGQGCS